MMTDDEEEKTVALLEALAEARTLIEDVSRLGEELKVRQDQLGELLAPSEAALTARTAYLDQVMREQLGRAEQRVTKLSADLDRLARSLEEHVMQMPSRLAEVDRQRAQATTRRELWRTALVIAAATVGGFLAGQAATCRLSTSPNPAAIEESATPKAKPSPSRKPAR
jgi:DNA repair exonuclease SbcCD ATPase subunit